jgi:hypothetical protein
MPKQRITAAPIGDLEIGIERRTIIISGYGSDECGVNCEATVRCEFLNEGDVERFLETLMTKREIKANFPLTSGQLSVKLENFHKIGWKEREEEICDLEIRYRNGGIEVVWSDFLAKVGMLEKLKSIMPIER